MASDPDKRFQCYRDLALSKKLGRTPAEREINATAIAEFLMLRDANCTGASLPPQGWDTKVQSNRPDAVQNIMAARIDAQRAYSAALEAISKSSLQAINSVFRDGLDMQKTGQPLTGFTESARNANAAVAKAFIISGAENLARVFRKMAARK